MRCARNLTFSALSARRCMRSLNSASATGVRSGGAGCGSRVINFAAGNGVVGPVRYGGPSPAEMTEGQRGIFDAIVATRTTGAAGPFGPWLANPAIAQPSQDLGRVVRYETSFPLRVSELAILVTAAHSRCSTEWIIHRGEAEKAGLQTEIIESILTGTTTAELFDDELDRVVWRFVDELARETRVSDDVYKDLVRIAGHEGAVELVAICGYYTYVAMTLNTFRLVPPAP